MKDKWIRRAAVLVVLSIWSIPARAQAPEPARPRFQDLLSPGETVWITDSVGREAKTQIVALDPLAVTTRVGGEIHRLDPSDIARVRVRRSDTVLDGALIGAGAAVASGLLLCRLTEPWENCRDDIGPMMRIGAIGAGAGIAIDALIRRRTTIYDAAGSRRSVHAAPIFGRGGAGLQLSVVF